MYKINTSLTDDDLQYYHGLTLDPHIVKSALIKTNKDYLNQFRDLSGYHAPLLQHIPLKNLSGAVGETFGSILAEEMGTVKKNPHESGAPDFIPIVPESKSWFNKPTKEYFNGGFDTKGTLSKDKNFVEATASSHHTQTSTVLTVLWTLTHQDGIEISVPEIIGVFYTNKLTTDDWSMSIPKDNNSKTTSSASLRSSGKEKLRKGWIVLSDEVYVSPRSMKLFEEKYGLY